MGGFEEWSHRSVYILHSYSSDVPSSFHCVGCRTSVDVSRDRTPSGLILYSTPERHTSHTYTMDSILEKNLGQRNVTSSPRYYGIGIVTLVPEAITFRIRGPAALTLLSSGLPLQFVFVPVTCVGYTCTNSAVFASASCLTFFF